MQKDHVLIVSTNKSLRRHVIRAMGSAGFPSTYCPLDRQEVLSALKEEPKMCVVDANEHRDDGLWVFQELYRNHQDVISLLISHERDNEIILQLLTQQNLNNLIAKHGGISATTDIIDETELIVTCKKLMCHDIFGIEKYLPTWGIQIIDHELTSTDDKAKVIGELETFLDNIDCYGPIKHAVILVADELLMNAIFSAPRDASGNPKYVTRDRSERIVLAPEERVAFRYACDGRNIVMSVKDQFGSLGRDEVVRYIQRCFRDEQAQVERKKGGAGLGLYMVFNSITQLTFNLHMGRATEVIALFYVRSGARAFRASGRSLNIFLMQ